MLLILRVERLAKEFDSRSVFGAVGARPAEDQKFFIELNSKLPGGREHDGLETLSVLDEVEQWCDECERFP